MSVINANGIYNGDTDFSMYPFELSNFQKHSIQAWLDGKNVLTTAATGSGKTLQAEYAINKIVKENLGKVIYASPIKSLSNDKFNDFKKKFPDADIGIITGDIKFNVTGNVLIMTTEILRNLLYNKKLRDITNCSTIEIDVYKSVHTVIFDEVHYINDKDRGIVWEECLILLPKNIRLINLSATISNPLHFCKWLAAIKNIDIVHTSTDKRVVPLRHSVFYDYLPSILKNPDNIDCKKINNTIRIFSDENDPFKSSEYSDILKGVKQTKSKMTRYGIINNLLKYLQYKQLTPVIFFSFSRKFCEKLANMVTNTLLEQDEISLVDKIIHKHLSKTDNYKKYIHLEQFYNLKRCLDKGVAFHHSGLLPVFKEIVEILFGHKDINGKPKPLVKALFATETFAVGVNMPTRTVVFTSLEKYTNGGKRTLYTHEYLQMAGRAGRRGIDSSGLVILLPNISNIPELSKMNNLLTGKTQSLQSKFSPNYKLVLKSIITKTPIDKIVNKSLISKEIKEELEYKLTELETINIPTNLDLEKYELYDKMVTGNYGLIRPSSKTLKKHKKQRYKLKNDPEFQKMYKEYSKYKSKVDRKHSILNDLKHTKIYISRQLESVMNMLIKMDYIKKNNDDDEYTASIKGIVASEINEANEIILTEILCSNMLDNLNYIQLGTVLSFFTDTKRLNKDGHYDCISKEDPYSSIIIFIKNIINKWSDNELRNKLYINTNWKLNFDLCNATHKWLNGCDFNTVINTYNIYEGNLIKEFLRMYNLAGSVRDAAQLLNKSQLIIEADKCMKNLMRDLVSTESLYIR